MDKNVVTRRMFDCLGIDRNKPSATFISEIKAQDKCWSKMPSCHLESSSIPQKSSAYLGWWHILLQIAEILRPWVDAIFLGLNLTTFLRTFLVSTKETIYNASTGRVEKSSKKFASHPKCSPEWKRGGLRFFWMQI